MNAPLPHMPPPVAIEADISTAPKPKRRRRWPLLTTGLIALAALGLIAHRYTRNPNANLATAPVTTGDIEQTVLATGTLKPVKLVAVGAQVSGRLVALNVKLGQKVKAGDLIAEIDSLTQQYTLRTNEAALRNVRAQRDEKLATLALAEANLARQQTTLAQKASSRADYDSAEATVKQTQAQIAQLEAQIVEAEVAIETARVNLGYTKITAPIDGTVLAIATPQGQTVNAVQSAPTIVVLGQVETMTVRVEISEADVVRVRPGQNAYFTILGDPDRRYTATLGSIEPAPESVKTDSSFSSTTTSSSSSTSTSSSSSSTAIYYNGVFDVANTDGRLMTYMTAEVHILLGEARNVLTIPSSALGNANADGSYPVRVLDDAGTLQKRSIRIGLNNKIRAEVQSGLREGERVVISAATDAPKQTVMPPPPSAGGL
ncbi:putative accessory protein to ABC-type macrolide transport protein MacB [Bradyrhizobium sp. ORS 285]|uniref:efflux RND transporter periplasmic adaptor subunit n=1 Tax=Bradyrhizobium sp. ORS 285 TaxID=115808 RepID=UPI0002407E51|nr:efflux RND transporter periplasmic adaptor subunit [Bradyrhizobium sp. ORS 285]CCD86187.1 putative accessory protein to ABC-type macrolide transport protein MacB [Bradyrhizobium sp. ORS 285]SMX60445.1 putative accessory protein to ABC-type macrolide transport protein MacB [Bradyrhizobium sp. ORS 285]